MAREGIEPLTPTSSDSGLNSPINVFRGKIHFELAKDTRGGNSKCTLSSYCADRRIEDLYPYTPLPSVTACSRQGSRFSRVIFFPFPFSLARDCCAFCYVCWR